MSFALSLAIVLGLAAVALGLVCYQLLGRLERLERAVHGGLEPPTVRYSREQFERRFRTAHARSQLATQVGTGVVVVLGPEADAGHDVVRTLAASTRSDAVSLVAAHPELALPALGLGAYACIVPVVDLSALGVTSTPFVFVLDDERVRMARPIASGADLINTLSDATR